MPNPFAVTTVKCAGPNCEAVRGEVNRWWLIGRTIDAETDDESFYCRPFKDPMGKDEQPACGEACAHKLLSQYMSEVK